MTGMGHEDQFLRPRLSVRWRFGQPTFTGTRGTSDTRRKRSLAEKRRICGIWTPKLAFKFCSAVDHRDPVVASVLSDRGASVG